MKFNFRRPLEWEPAEYEHGAELAVAHAALEYYKQCLTLRQLKLAYEEVGLCESLIDYAVDAACYGLLEMANETRNRIDLTRHIFFKALSLDHGLTRSVNKLTGLSNLEGFSDDLPIDDSLWNDCKKWLAKGFSEDF